MESQGQEDSKGQVLSGEGDDWCGQCSSAVERRCLALDKLFVEVGKQHLESAKQHVESAKRNIAMEQRFLEIERSQMNNEGNQAQFLLLSRVCEDISRKFLHMCMDMDALKTAVHRFCGVNIMQPEFIRALPAQGLPNQNSSNQQQPNLPRVHVPEELLPGGGAGTSRFNRRSSTTSEEQSRQLQPETPAGVCREQSNSQADERKSRKNNAPKKRRIMVKEEPSLNCKISDYEFESLEVPLMGDGDAAVSSNKLPDADEEARFVCETKPTGVISENNANSNPIGLTQMQAEHDDDVIIDNEAVGCVSAVNRGIIQENLRYSGVSGAFNQEVGVDLSKTNEEIVRRRGNEAIKQWKVNVIRPNGSIEVDFGPEVMSLLKEQQNHPLDFSKASSGRREKEKSDDRDSGTAEMCLSPDENRTSNLENGRSEINTCNGGNSEECSPVRKRKSKKAKAVASNQTQSDRKAHGKCRGKTGRPKLDDPRARDYCCSYCGNKYLTKSGLFDHFKRIHQIAGSLHHSILIGEMKHGVGAIIKQYPCLNCGDNFRGSQELAHHKMYQKCHSKGYTRLSNGPGSTTKSDEPVHVTNIKQEFSSELHQALNLGSPFTSKKLTQIK